MREECSEKGKRKTDAIVCKILQLLESENLNVYDADRILNAVCQEVNRSVYAMKHTTMMVVPEILDEERRWGVFTSPGFD